MSIIFDYAEFYKFYTDPQPTIFTYAPGHAFQVSYFTLNKTKGYKSKVKITPPTFIISNGIQIYITVLGAELLFSIPTLLPDGLYWDFHYHVGLTAQFTDQNDKIKKNMIFFHKTIQVPVKNKNEQKRCYFPDQLDITDVRNIVCKDNVQKKQCHTIFHLNMKKTLKS